MIDITLAKAKYRNSNVKVVHRSGIDPADGTRVWLAEAHIYKPRTGNCHQSTPKCNKSPSGKGTRRKAYGPF